MTTISFSLKEDKLKKILKLKEELDMNMSQVVSFLVQRGLAYTELLKAEEETKNNKGEI